MGCLMQLKKHFMDVTESSYPDHDDIVDNAFTVFNRMKEFKSYPVNHDSEYAKISKTVTLNTGIKSILKRSLVVIPLIVGYAVMP